jgi:hypothetical protein
VSIQNLIKDKTMISDKVDFEILGNEIQTIEAEIMLLVKKA